MHGGKCSLSKEKRTAPSFSGEGGCAVPIDSRLTPQAIPTWNVLETSRSRKLDYVQ
jgi:hypothetical protein